MEKITKRAGVHRSETRMDELLKGTNDIVSGKFLAELLMLSKRPVKGSLKNGAQFPTYWDE